MQEVHAEDTVAEEEFRDAQENYSVGDPHAEYHAAGEHTCICSKPQLGYSQPLSLPVHMNCIL